MTYVGSDARLPSLLRDLMRRPALDFEGTLTAAADAVATWLECDKVDVFLADRLRTRLVALGTSRTPLGQLQHDLGLNVMAIASGGRAVEVFDSGQPFFSEHADQDPIELPAIIRELGVRSQVCAPLEIAGVRRGVLAIVSQTPAYFKPSDVDNIVIVASWVSALAHRAELVQQQREEDARKARVVVAEEIITVLAHDIRNHLQPLSGRLQLLQMKIASNEAIEATLLTPALAAVRRLERMTRDLLDLARLDQGLFDLQLAPQDICEIVAECAEACATTRTAIEVKAPDQLVAIIDKARLQQALENVVINGVRHSPAGKPLRLSVETTDDGRGAEILVADEGSGIRPELLPHLFERFVAGRESKGMGLGLYLAERIARAHGGSLRVESRLGLGSSFRFSLPINGPVQ